MPHNHQPAHLAHEEQHILSPNCCACSRLLWSTQLAPLGGALHGLGERGADVESGQ